MFHKASQLVPLLFHGAFARDAAILAGANILANLFNYGYQMLMARMLLPTEYGVLASLLAMFMILSVISPAFQLSAAKYTATARTEGGETQIRALWEHFLKRALVAGLVGSVLALALLPMLSRLLHIDSIGLLVLLAASFLFALALPVNMGVLQGLQRFAMLSVGMLGTTFIRIALGVSLVALGLGVYGAFLPLLVGSIVVFGLTLAPLRKLPRGDASPPVAGWAAYIGWTSLALGAFVVLANMDMILAKFYLDADAAGEYAAVAVLGRIVLFAPVGAIFVMFPKTADRSLPSSTRRALLALSLLYTLATAGVVLAAYALFPSAIVSALVGDQYAPISSSLLPYAGGMLGLAVAFLLIHYSLSINRTTVAYAVMAAVVVQLALTLAFHSNVDQLVHVRLASGVSSVVAVALYGVLGHLPSAAKAIKKRASE
jgi:O-antigen/teichoic acid export membrane protein